MRRAIFGIATHAEGPHAVGNCLIASSSVSPSEPQNPMVTSTTMSAARRPGSRFARKPAFLNIAISVGGISFMIIRPVVVLPQPDSPTRPTVSPRPMSKLMPSTARTAAGALPASSPRRSGKCFTRLRTWISGAG